jgi:adenine-specific DNA-methyltransferase
MSVDGAVSGIENGDSLSRLAYEPQRHAYQKTGDYLFSQLIPYIGSKRKLLPLIARAVALTGADPRESSFADLFAGSGVVSRMAKSLGFSVVSNDWEPYAAALNGAFVALDGPPVPTEVFEELNALPSVEGYITRHFCPTDDAHPRPNEERCFYTRANGMRIDAIREQIARWELEGEIDTRTRRYLLGPLLSCASYVSNTSGLFKAYHAGWGGATGTALYRILSDLTLRPPILLKTHRPCTVTQMDATLCAQQWPQLSADKPAVAYIDPPYNQHPYGSNYHLLNSIALWDKLEIPPFEQSKCAIRTDWRTGRRSAYNNARSAMPALLSLIDALPCRWVALSYSTDGNIDIEQLCVGLAQRGHLQCLARPYKRYRVSSQRFSPRARNVEFVLLLDRQSPPSDLLAHQCFSQIAAIAGKLL